MSPVFMQAILAGAAVFSAVCAGYVAWRASRWRQSDELKTMMSEAASRWVETPAAKTLLGRVDEVESRLDVVETVVEALPSKADLEQLRGEVREVAAIGRRTEAGIQRIEDFWMAERAR